MAKAIAAGGVGTVEVAARICSVVVSPGVSMNRVQTDKEAKSSGSSVVRESAVSVADPNGPDAVRA